MKIALVLCPAWSREMPHLAIGMLSACLRKEGHQVFAFDLNNAFYHKCTEKYREKWRKEQDWFWVDPRFIAEFVSENKEIINQAVQEILATDARIIGFSVYYPTELMSLELARRIKEIDPQRTIVFGGFQCLRELKGEILIQDAAVDMIVVGEGERTITEVAATFARDGSVDFCEGTILKKPEGIMDCGNRAPLTDLDNLPFPDFSDFSSLRYERPDTMPLLFSRGCFQTCVYCTVNLFWRKYRTMSAGRMFQEIQWHLKNFPAVYDFFIYDPLLNGNIRELTQLCDLIINNTAAKAIPSIEWSGQGIIRPEMTPELLNKMKQAGCRAISYGIESGSQAVLDKMKKRFIAAEAERVIRHTHEAGIEVSLNFMFGFPGETEEHFRETLDFITRNHEYIDKVLPSESFCYIDKGTYLYNHPEEFGIPAHPSSSFWESLDGKNTFPERMRRFEAFCELAHSLGMGIGVSCEKIKLFKQESLEKYFEYKQQKDGLLEPKLQEKPETGVSKPLVSFSWDLLYTCNYRCPYCWWHGRWQDLSKSNRFLSIEELARYWNNIYRKYGSAHIEILGGEPFLYPQFKELVKELSRMHTLGITTNLSTEISSFVDQIDPARVKVWPTFHPTFADCNAFLQKAKLLKEKGFTSNAYYLAYPPQIKFIDSFRRKFGQENIPLLLLTYWGTFNGIAYPDGYTEEEKAIIHGSVAKREGEAFQMTPKKEFRGKLCNAGRYYAVIKPDGAAVRCGGSGLNEEVGNFFDENFALLDTPLPCKVDTCKCNEWAFLLEEGVQEIEVKTPQKEERVQVKPVESIEVYADEQGRKGLGVPEVPDTNSLEERRSIEASPVEFSWEICYTCNYRCPYCGRWNDASPEDLVLSVEEWERIWGRVYQKYGSCNMYLSGAEPTTYPHFFDIVEKVAAMHTITICTNFSWDTKEILQRNLSPQRVQFTPTFHSTFADFETFLDKAVQVKEWVRNRMVFFVAYEPQMARVEHYKKSVNKSGLEFCVVPLRGNRDGHWEVISSQEEKEKIGAITDMHDEEFAYLAQKNSPKGKPCRAGYRYAIIKPTGKVFPCSQNCQLLGYIHRDDFKLLQEPTACSSEFCPYESYNLLERHK